MECRVPRAWWKKYQKRWFGRGDWSGGIDDRLIRQKLKAASESPRFIYWLTLNSHLPVDGRTARTDKLDCDSLPQLRNDSDVCDLARVLHWTNSAIARLVSDPELPPTRFIIVGDHAPPFLSRDKRAFYSQTRVPYISLVPISTGSNSPKSAIHIASHTPRP